MKPVQFPKQKPDDYPDVEAARRADQAKAAEAADKAKDAQPDAPKTSLPWQHRATATQPGKQPVATPGKSAHASAGRCGPATLSPDVNWEQRVRLPPANNC